MARRELRILHCLRAPVGGLFRHVYDLASEQARRGHEVGLICATAGDRLTDQRLDALSPMLQLGLHRLPIGRTVGLGDMAAVRAVRRLAADLDADVLHGHGAKGGAYARLASAGRQRNAVCLYTPHGGSLHYTPDTMAGRAVSMAERLLERWTDGLLFESAYAADRYRAQIGRPNCPTSVVVNGVGAADLVPVVPQAGATDVLFVGELRRLKGVDVLLAALALANASRPVTATIVGDGPDAEQFRQQTAALGLETRVVFTGALPAVEAWPLGHVFVLPSRAESLPYVLLEAGGRELPIITTRVGGIPQLVEKTGTPLVNPGDAYALAAALLDTLGDPVSARQRAAALRTRIAEVYSIHAMADGVLGFYAALRAARRGPAASPRPLSVEP